jgi:glycosyltransferase involved in cell wall biosynthesis
MKVLHAPSEIAGQTSILARALRELGVEAWSLATNPTFAQYSVDEMRPYDAMPPLRRYAGYAGLLAANLFQWDVFHFHFGRTLIPPHNFDLPLYHALGKRLVYHFHGCDVRDRARMLATHAHATCTECDPPFCIPARQKRVLGEAARYADAQIVSTPDLLESAPLAQQVHVAIPLADYAAAPFRETPRVVLHAPTNRLIKGTPYVEQAFEALRPRFPGVTFHVLEKKSWPELKLAMADCDVFVDQVHMGWYGMVTVEAMAMARPALCYIRPDFEPRMKDCPVVRTSVETLTEDLAALLQDAPRRRELGERGRGYVEREHEARVIAARLIALYRSLGVA